MKTVKHGEMRKEYRREDLGKGIRGKYFEEYKKGTNLVLLSPDVAAVFPDDALRSLMKIAQKTSGLTLKRPPVAKRKNVPDRQK
ncbi:MAG: hypothetical protein JETT_3058 [Candidatus Jettenia ecosi]|uniref:Uncharacterized protein n=1 Tax=Candidatus Jettenia ecosi TaxID=2494326 RepID=A0A533QJF4_9BACT|nr:MAG: hypothetical protein JETT_3058 [Candidatus Jettenia ecosi]